MYPHVSNQSHVTRREVEGGKDVCGEKGVQTLMQLQIVWVEESEQN